MLLGSEKFNYKINYIYDTDTITCLKNNIMNYVWWNFEILFIPINGK